MDALEDDEECQALMHDTELPTKYFRTFWQEKMLWHIGSKS